MKKSKKSKKYYGGGPYQSLLPLLVAFIVGVMTPILYKKVKPASAPAPAANPQATGKGKTGGRTLRQLKERARELGAVPSLAAVLGPAVEHARGPRAGGSAPGGRALWSTARRKSLQEGRRGIRQSCSEKVGVAT